ncbi:MAG: FxsA family protein [Spirochaetes bacterium]|jgi:UPF0716 protein FxsA|nr:FxsA family protein [Spirochaetota bacterium]
MATRLRLLSLVDRAFVVRLLLVMLLASLIVVADGYALIELSTHLGRYLSLAVVASTGFVGLFFLANSILATLSAVRRHVRTGSFPKRDFARLASLFISAGLIVLPGLVTDLIGIVIYTPPVRLAFGLLMVRSLDSQLWQIYEHVKLQEAENEG